MQFWFSRQSDTSIREQLATQIILAIVSGEFAPGQRLPSTRELARRFRLHPNTISSCYRELEKRNWLECRKGSGVYVTLRQPNAPNERLLLDRLIADFFRAARRLNTPLALVHDRLKRWLEMQPPDHFLVIEPDEQLARIVISEMQNATSLPIKTLRQMDSELLAGAVLVMLSVSSKRVQHLDSHNGDILTLHIRSAREALTPYLPVLPSMLIGIASAWPPFLKNARTMLISAGFHPDCLLVRNTTKPGWRRGLKEAAAIVCDSVTATNLEGHPRVLTFPLLSNKSIQELQHYERFIRDPLRA